MYAIYTNRTDVGIRLKHTVEEALRERKIMKLWLGDIDVQIVELSAVPIDPKIIEDHDETVKYTKRETNTSIKPSFEILPEPS